MSLYLKYRPSDFDSIKGNQELVSTLKGMLSNLTTCPHSFLFFGPTGCGKTTLGRIVAHSLHCIGTDLREVDSADFRGIDTIREIRKNSMFLPIEGECRVWIIDECHKMTNDAQNALLKILEDTPDHVYFVLCTTDPQKLLPTIKGRCSQFQVHPLTEKQMYGLLRVIVKEEGETLETEVYNSIIESAKGHSRNALQILEQVLNVPTEDRLKIAKKAEAEIVQAIDLCRALVNGAPWSKIANLLSSMRDQEAEGIRRCVLGYCQSTLLSGKDNKLYGLIMEEFINPFYDSGFPQLTFACYNVVKFRNA